MVLKVLLMPMKGMQYGIKGYRMLNFLPLSIPTTANGLLPQIIPSLESLRIFVETAAWSLKVAPWKLM